MIISVTKDAYKQLVSPSIPSKYDSKDMIQLKMSDEEIQSKLKTYKINNEDKKFRIIKPIFDEKGIVVNISVLIEVSKENVTWNR